MSKTKILCGWMLLLLAVCARMATAQEVVRLSPPQLWASGFAAGTRIPLAADVDGDGRADLLALSPDGEATIDVARTSSVGKPRFPTQARHTFGVGAVAAACGTFTQRDRADVLAVFGSGEVRIAYSFQSAPGRYAKDAVVATLPAAQLPKAPVRVLTADIDGDGKPDVVLIDADGRLMLLANESTDEGVPRFTPHPISGTIANVRRIAAGDLNGSGRASIVWLDASGGVFRAEIRAGRSQQLALGRPARIWSASPDDGVAVGRFTGGKAADVLVGRVLLVAGNPKRILSQPDLPQASEAKNDVAWIAADFDGDGKDDLLRVRRSSARFVGDDLLIHFSRANLEPAWNVSTMHDGLLDIWKTGVVKPGGIDLAALGCATGHRDVIVEAQRIADVSEAVVRQQVDRAVAYFASLPIDNPDRTKGIALHVIYREPIPLADKDVPWQVLAEKYHPRGHRGVTHWLVIYNGGGGQSAEMADRGSCGVRVLYATFLHEFGHQLGLDHTGHWGPSWCPTYPSLMNYAYNYQLNGSMNNIGFSDGRLASVVLNEQHLSERLPLPMEKVSFLAGPPYFYRLRPTEEGQGTLIDWNWNGIFGEKDVAADINYGYSTTAGPRNIVTKSYIAPVLTSSGDGNAERQSGVKTVSTTDRDPAASSSRLFLFFGRLPDGTQVPPADATAKQPSLSPEQPGSLRMRVWEGHTTRSDGDKWSGETDVEAAGVVGDATAATLHGTTWIAYPVGSRSTPQGAQSPHPPFSKGAKGDSGPGGIGVALRKITLDAGGRPQIGERFLVPGTEGVQPTLAEFGGRLILLLWRGAATRMAYRFLNLQGERLTPEAEQSLEFTSNGPVGVASESGSALWIGLTQDFPRGFAASRWQVRRFALTADGGMQQTEMEWVGGERGGMRGTGRVVLLHEDNAALGPQGQLYFFGCGLTTEQAPWECHYVATRIADKDIHGGWLTRRYFDEWTQSRSAPAACFFGGDIVFASRWFGNSSAYSNDDLFVAFFGKGIETEPMGDFDDIGFIRDIGLSHCILYCGE